MSLTPCINFARTDWNIFNPLISLDIRPETTVEEFEAKMAQLRETIPAMAAFTYDALANTGGQTLLSMAAIKGNVALINHFVLKGGQALLQIGDNTGNTPLHWTVKKGHKLATRALLKLGANPNLYARQPGQALDDILSDPDTALMVAMKEPFPDRNMVKLLVEQGAQLHPRAGYDPEKASLLQQVRYEVAVEESAAFTFCWEQLGLRNNPDDAAASAPSDQLELDALPREMVEKIDHTL